MTPAILHRFPDGWTIRQLLSVADLRTEAAALGSCLGHLIDLPPEHRPPLELLHDHHILSLRDPDNRPVVSFLTGARGFGPMWPTDISSTARMHLLDFMHAENISPTSNESLIQEVAGMGRKVTVRQPSSPFQGTR